MESYTYPEALGGLFFSASRQMFRVVPISVHAVENRHRGTTHSHDFFQFWYTLSGRWYHTADGVTTKQVPGSAALIFPYTPHSINTLHADPEQLQVLEEDAGLHFLLRVDTDLPDGELTARWAEFGIRIRALSDYYHAPVPEEDRHNLVVHYAGLREEELDRVLGLIRQGPLFEI